MWVIVGSLCPDLSATENLRGAVKWKRRNPWPKNTDEMNAATKTCHTAETKINGKKGPAKFGVWK